MKNIALYVDTNDLYRRINKKFVGKTLQYSQYKKFVEDLGHITISRAYSIDYGDSSAPFVKVLKTLGFSVRSKKPRLSGGYTNPNVSITLDVINDIENDNIDLVILGSSNPDLASLIRYIKSHGKEVLIFSCGIPLELKKNSCNFIEIPESLTIVSGVENEKTKTV